MAAEERIDHTVTPPVVAQSFSWWVAQADAVTATCAKCEGAMDGVYVPPTQATMGECAVVAHCRMCGAELMVIAGRAGVPYSQSDLDAARAHRPSPDPARSTVYRRRMKVYRPARVAGGQGKTRKSQRRRQDAS
mgnify:CR=1 FL=1